VISTSASALWWLRIKYEVSFKSRAFTSAWCASCQPHCLAAVSSTAPGRLQREELAVHAKDEEGDWLADPKQQQPSLAGDGGLPLRASTSTSPPAMVSYSSDPFSSPCQDIDFILLLLLRNWIRCLYAYVLAPVPLSWSRLPNRDLVLVRVRTALSCAFSFAVCSRDVQRRRSFASIIRLFCFV
jgi:hypothetical protein